MDLLSQAPGDQAPAAAPPMLAQRQRSADKDSCPGSAPHPVCLQGRPGVSLPPAGPFPPHHAHDSRPRLQNGYQPPLLRPAAAAPKAPAPSPTQRQIPQQPVPQHPGPAPLPRQSQQAPPAAQRPPPWPSNGAGKSPASQKQPAARPPTSTHPTMSPQHVPRPDGVGQRQQQQVPAGASRAPSGVLRQNPITLHKVQPWQNRPPCSYRQPLQHKPPQPDKASSPGLGVSEHLPEPVEVEPLAEADPQRSAVIEGGGAARDPTVAEKLLEKGFEPYSFEVGPVLASQLAVRGATAQTRGQRVFGRSGCRHRIHGVCSDCVVS